MANEYGKKVFFLYPPSVIKDEMLRELINFGYEVYLLHDYEKLLKLLEVYNDSILFINIDKVLQEPDWEQYVQCILNNPQTKGVSIGILTYNEDNFLAKKYLFQLKVKCGFIKLKLGFSESLKIILKTLQFTEARGRRKHIRVACEGEYKAAFNIKICNEIYTGEIRDISIAGMACVFEKKNELDTGQRLDNIQLRLQGQVCKLSGVIEAVRQAEKELFVILFDNSIDPKTMDKIYDFIYNCLQDSINQKLKSLGK